MNLSALRIRVWEQGDAVCCSLQIPLKIGGFLRIVTTLSSERVLSALKRAGIKFSQQELAAIGSVFGGIGKFLKKVAKTGVLKTALKLGVSLVNSPLVKIIAPQAAAAIQAASMAAKLVQAAKGKDPARAQKAKLAIVAAKAQAAKEQQTGQPMPLPTGVANRSPQTQAAFRYLVTLNRVAA